MLDRRVRQVISAAVVREQSLEVNAEERGIRIGEQRSELKRLEDKKETVLNLLGLLPLDAIAQAVRVDINQVEEWQKEAHK